MRWLIAMLLCVTATARASPHKVAVLPLEPTLTPAPAEARFAVDVTTELRAAMAADFTIVAARFASLAAAKRVARCSTEATACMAVLGAQLGADLLVFGKIRRTSSGYQVTVKLLDVGRRRVLRIVSDEIVANDASGPRLVSAVQATYARLVGN